MHCNFICSLSDVIIKNFSQSVSQLADVCLQELTAMQRCDSERCYTCCWPTDTMQPTAALVFFQFCLLRCLVCRCVDRENSVEMFNQSATDRWMDRQTELQQLYDEHFIPSKLGETDVVFGLWSGFISRLCMPNYVSLFSGYDLCHHG